VLGHAGRIVNIIGARHHEPVSGLLEQVSGSLQLTELASALPSEETSVEHQHHTGVLVEQTRERHFMALSIRRREVGCTVSIGR
jgi:hypothetical protein